MPTINATDARSLRPPKFDYDAVVNSDVRKGTFVTGAGTTRQPAANAADIDERLTRISECIANAVQKIYGERPVVDHFALPSDEPRAAKNNALTSNFRLPKGDDESGNADSPAASGFKLPS